jgi:hypothetical protein
MLRITNPVTQNHTQRQRVFKILSLPVTANTSSFFIGKFY